MRCRENRENIGWQCSVFFVAILCTFLLQNTLVFNNGDFDFKYSTNVATLFNAFLIETYGEDTYFEFVLFESDTISKKEAFLATYGDIKEIEKQWKAWINK